MHLHHTLAQGICTRHLHWAPAQGICIGCLHQPPAQGVHTVHPYRLFAQGVICTGHLQPVITWPRGLWAAAAQRAQGGGWESPEQVIKAVLNVCLHAGENTPNYPAGVGREGGAAPIAIT